MKPPLSDANELTSWKEIAVYLKVNVRTAQKWERDRGMPVQRLPGGRGRVAIKIADLELWKGSNKDASCEKPFWTAAKKWPAFSLVLILVLILMAPLTERLDGTPCSTQIRGNNLVVLNARGHELWRRSFPYGLEPTAEMIESHDNVSQAWIADLDGDGKQEILFRTRYPRELVSQPLICYSAFGDEKWRYVPTATVRTRHESFPPTYLTDEVAILRSSQGAPSRIVATFSEVPYYPSQLVLLSAQGEVIRNFWHSGHLRSLVVTDLNQDGKPEIYLAGVANGWRAATLLAVDPENFGGASDESQSPDYQLLGFGPEKILARVIFGRSRINRELWSLNSAIFLKSIPGGLQAEVLEYQRPNASVNYEFGPHLVLQSVDLADSYEICHKGLVAKNLIHWKFDALREESELKKNLLYLKR